MPDSRFPESEDILTVARMPWKETDPMKERMKFVSEWERRWNETEGRVNVAELSHPQQPPWRSPSVETDREGDTGGTAP